MADDAVHPGETLDEWALRYHAVATVGVLALFLGVGKFMGHHWESMPVLRRVLVPPAVLSGMAGCILYRACKGFMASGVRSALNDGLTEIVVMMINFTFAALTLGFASAGTYVPRTRAILASIWHEAMPMLVYSQVLIWGQSWVALGTVGLLRIGNPNISQYLGALITTGLETGRDVTSFSSEQIEWEEANEVVRLADSVGLTISIVGCIILMTVHMGGRGQTAARGYSLVSRDSSTGSMVDGFDDMQGGGGRQNEHFERGRSSGPLRAQDTEQTRGITGSRSSIGRNTRMPSAESDARSPSRHFSPARRTQGSVEAIGPGAGLVGRDIGPTLSIHKAGLGAHLLLPAVAVGAAWLVDFCIRFLENRIEYTSKHHIISGFRLFKLSMCAALFFMCIIRRSSPFRYHSEWFFRLSGLCLDLMTTAAIGSIGFAKIPDTYSAAFFLVVIACVTWNVLVFVALAPRMFPNFWFLRATALIGDALGHSWVGLLVLRVMDPRLQTPVPLAYAYKMMLFFVPASGGKNAIVVAMVDVMGIWKAFLVCLAVCGGWLLVFERYFKARMPQNQQRKEDEHHGRIPKPRPPKPVRKKSEETELVHVLSNASAHAVGPGIEEELPREVRLEEPSKILSKARLQRLAESLPAGEAIKTWRLAYSIARDGASLWTLMQRCTRHGSCLVVIEDSWGYVFGGFIANGLQESQEYYGTGESFVFSFNPSFSAYRWTGVNDYFCISNDSWLAMGGGGGGFAFQIDDELDAGESNPSDTFGNPRLSSNEFFKCLSVEVWCFADVTMNI